MKKFIVLLSLLCLTILLTSEDKKADNKTKETPEESPEETPTYKSVRLCK